MAESGTLQLAAAFDRAVGDRLAAAERLALWMVPLFGARLVDCDVGYRSAQRFFLLVVRLAGATPEDESRFRFWCARSGALASSLGAMKERERSVFANHVAQCDVKILGVRPALLADAVGRVAATAGARDRRPQPGERPVLAMDAGSQGFAGVTWDPGATRLFVPGAITPPAGDAIEVSLRVPRTERPFALRGRVVEVRSLPEARPGAPAGFTLEVAQPSPAAAEALAHHAPRPDEPGATGRRAAPRYALNAPVKVQPDGATTARLEYASDQDLADDYVENLSQGGAFVRSASAPAVGTRLTLEMRLPGAIELRAPAVVMYRDARGMGVRFELDAEGQEKLATAIARISARPRRALLVDDDALILHTLGDALHARGFDVLTARDGAEGLGIVMDELLSLDLLVTDVRMPNMDGESFVRTIRGAGGEAELAIVVIAGTLESGLEARMEKAGADAVLDKALGPANLAAAADAALERKRLQGAG